MNNLEKGVPPMDQPSKHPQPEKPATPQNPDIVGSTSRDLEIKKLAAEKRDAAKIAKIRDSLGLERADTTKELQQHLQEYLGLKEGAVERIGLLKAKNLPNNYQAQREALHDERLDEVTIAVVPDDLWIKGSQPSESSAEDQLILIKQSYFEEQKNPDEIAWMIHELAHCQNFLDSESAEAYQKDAQTFAFDDLQTAYLYPNNLVEQRTFTKQFQYLKEQGKGRENVLAMLSEQYDKEDFPFFNRLLDSVYGE